MKPQDDAIVFDMEIYKNSSCWEIINDDVMGGLSEGMLSLTENNSLLFGGHISTEIMEDFLKPNMLFCKEMFLNITGLQCMLKVMPKHTNSV